MEPAGFLKIMLVSVEHNKNRGFTLLEVLLSVTMLALLGAVGTPIYQSLQIRNDLDIAANTIESSLHRAQMLSVAVDGDSSWGLSIQSGVITLFQGSNYASRNAGFDEVFSLPASITPLGVSEIVYGKFTGEPQVTGTITLVSSANEIRHVTVNTKGMVDLSNTASSSTPEDPPVVSVSYDYSITSDWTTGFCANVDITTESVVPIVWEVSVPLNTPPLNGTPYTVWNADWSFVDPVLITSGAGWNDEVSASQSQQFGFCANR